MAFGDVPAWRSHAAPDAAQEDGAVVAPDPVFVAAKQVAVEPVPHTKPQNYKNEMWTTKTVDRRDERARFSGTFVFLVGLGANLVPNINGLSSPNI